MTEGDRCIVCGKPASTTVRMANRNGSVIVTHFCSKHERLRVAGKRRTRKAINDKIRGMFK